MKTILTSDPKQISLGAARVALGAAAGTVALLASLHVISPEFDPSWRMVSEYANGDYGWVLSLMFAAWAVSSWALVAAIRSQVKSRAGKVGLALLALAGVGQAMAAVFDVNHPLHDMAGNIGIGCFVVAAMMISTSLGRTKAWLESRKLLLWTANLTWVSVVLVAITFAVLISTYMQTGADMTAASTEITTLPDGVIALVGWTNRLLVLAYVLWTATVAWKAIKLRG